MRQRVAIARALAPQPDVLLLDEPFGALDAITKRSMQEFIRTVWLRTGVTILMVTHDVPEAIYLSQRIYVMTPRPGRVRTTIDVPFGTVRGPNVKRDARFLDLVDEIEDLLQTRPRNRPRERRATPRPPIGARATTPAPRRLRRRTVQPVGAAARRSGRARGARPSRPGNYAARVLPAGAASRCATPTATRRCNCSCSTITSAPSGSTCRTRSRCSGRPTSARVSCCCRTWVGC